MTTQQNTEHRLMPNMLRYVPRDVADQIIADVEDSLWLAEHDEASEARAVSAEATVDRVRGVVIASNSIGWESPAVLLGAIRRALADQALPSEATTDETDEWCMAKNCQWLHWRSGSLPTHRRGSECPPVAVQGITGETAGN